ncbi:hypothetical protein ACKVEX_01535 [Rhodocyclaceae bacterium SMB388]
MNGRRFDSGHQHGIALVAMMWLLAALALLVAGQVGATRADLRSLQTFRSFAEHAALGDGAIRLTMAEIAVSPPPTRPLRRTLQIGEHRLRVEAVPASALIDLNNAPPELLHDALVFGAGLSADRAGPLVDALVAWRDPEVASLAGNPTPSVGRIGGFDTIEDLVQVPGVDLALYQRLSDLVTVHNPLTGVDPRFASDRVLTILSRGDRVRVERVLAARDTGDPAMDIADLPHAQISHSGIRVMRVAATRRVGDATLTRVGWLANERVPHSGVPWRELAFEPVRSVTMTERHDGG